MKIGANGTQLKVLALTLMLIDHIAEYIPGVPVYFHWLGRISAPLFMFSMGGGCIILIAGKYIYLGCTVLQF